MDERLPPLALPDHGLKTKHDAAGPQVFDAVRRLWVALTPEEWVRQHFINHLVHDLGYPASRISVERALTLHGLTKRADVVVFGADGSPEVLVECKAPHVRITQRTFEQAAHYNIVLKVGLLMVTNGLQHFSCRIDHRSGTVQFLDHLPAHGVGS